MQLISWSTLSQGCLVSQVTYFTLFHFKSPYLWEPNVREPKGTLLHWSSTINGTAELIKHVPCEWVTL
jgi:hypothetical protein